MRKQSMMGSSKYEYNPNQLDEDVLENAIRYRKTKELIREEILENFQKDASRMEQTFSIYLEVLREIKNEWNL